MGKGGTEILTKGVGFFRYRFRYPCSNLEKSIAFLMRFFNVHSGAGADSQQHLHQFDGGEQGTRETHRYMYIHTVRLFTLIKEGDATDSSYKRKRK
jgi:hypothetical protein